MVPGTLNLAGGLDDHRLGDLTIDLTYTGLMKKTKKGGYQPKFGVSPKLVGRLENIATLREKIISAAVQVPWVPVLQKETRDRTIHSSTAIEGNPLTLDEVRLLAEGSPAPDIKDRPRREILNQLAALRFITKASKTRRVLESDIRQINKLVGIGVMDQGRSGSYRNMGVTVGDFRPPGPVLVPPLMEDLVRWWNEDASKLSPVLSSGILHYRFEEIHPFADGNGRTGRLLALWELYRRDFDTHHIFAVDEFYWEDRPRYYRELKDVRKRKGDLTVWLEYVAEGLETVLSQARDRLQNLGIQSKAGKISLRPRQEKLLGILRDRGPMAPAELRSILALSKQGTLDLLRPLMQADLVRRVGGHKTGKYELVKSRGRMSSMDLGDA